jgi:methyltransferase (TIGR00027 family)
MNGLSNRGSRTAILTAVARALHRDEPRPWVLDDELAARLAGDEGVRIREELVSALPEDVLLAFSRWTCVRARFPEDVLERAMERGIDRYVVLGAGLDSFAYRRGDLEQRIRVFEVDHPSTQAWKRSRLRALGIEEPPHLVFAGVDFEHQTLRDGLEAAGFDFSRPAVFSWIGVTMYLSLEAIEATLETVASCPPGTRLVMTYDRPTESLGELGRRTQTILKEITRGMGEPIIRFFEPSEIERLLSEHGFTQIEHVGPDEAIATYFPGRRDVRFGGAQCLATATVR